MFVGSVGAETETKFGGFLSDFQLSIPVKKK